MIATESMKRMIAYPSMIIRCFCTKRLLLLRRANEVNNWTAGEEKQVNTRWRSHENGDRNGENRKINPRMNKNKTSINT